MANRVRYIQQRSDVTEWQFVAGKENPADLCSRGVSASSLVEENNIWWTGPQWLGMPKEGWPSAQELDTTDFEKLVASERRAEATVVLIVAPPPTILDINRYSIWSRLLRITAYILRQFRNAGAAHWNLPDEIMDGGATAAEINRAKVYWLRHIQASAFAPEFEKLQNNELVLHRSSIATLQPWLDRTDGLIKLRGRTGLSNLLDETPDIPILPARLPGDD